MDLVQIIVIAVRNFIIKILPFLIDVIPVGALIMTVLIFLASVTDWFKKSIPVKFGFLVDGSIVTNLSLSSGDPEKPIFLRFCNRGRITLVGLIFNIQFLHPLSLSGSSSALSLIPGKTVHGRVSDRSYYLIRYSDIELVGLGKKDFRIELNTKGKTPGTYKVLITVYSTQKDYEFKKIELSIEIT